MSNMLLRHNIDKFLLIYKKIDNKNTAIKN